MSVGGIRGGVPFQPDVTPGNCSNAGARLAPNREPIEIKREFEGALATAGVSTDLHLFLSPYQPSNTAIGGGPRRSSTGVLDDAIINPHVLPSGHPDPYQSTLMADLIRATKIYAAVAMELSGVSAR